MKQSVIMKSSVPNYGFIFSSKAVCNSEVVYNYEIFSNLNILTNS